MNETSKLHTKKKQINPKIQSHQVSEGGKPFFKAPRPGLRWGNECGGLGWP